MLELNRWALTRALSWTLGVGQWPNAGEIDMYEGWNLNVFNNPAMHVGPEAEFGSCTVHETDQTASVTTSNCDNAYTDGESQWPGQGCQSEESRNGIWGSEEGGISKLPPQHNAYRETTSD